eukprot:9172028-Alexandrium_andersonii.AAC.1
MAFVTPLRQAEEGVAWCDSCLGRPDILLHGAAWVAAAAGVDGAGDVAAAPPQWAGPATTWDGRLAASAVEPCSLCGYGEFSAEHLLVWCPAVLLAV